MNGVITTWFAEKGFGFIKDENGDNRYFHIIKVSNPELIKKNAAVTFEPTENSKGLSAFAVNVEAESKYLFVAGERIKISAIKSFKTWQDEIKADGHIDKDNTVLSVGLLMNSIRPKAEQKSGTTRTVEKLSINTFHNQTFVFSEDEIDIAETVNILKGLPGVS